MLVFLLVISIDYRSVIARDGINVFSTFQPAFDFKAVDTYFHELPDKESCIEIFERERIIPFSCILVSEPRAAYLSTASLIRRASCNEMRCHA